MNDTSDHHEDPSFRFALHDTSGDDYSPESMEVAHELVEDARAEALGATSVAQEVTVVEVLDETQSNFDNFMKLLLACDTTIAVKILFENSIDQDRTSGLLTEEQYQSLVSMRRNKELYLRHMSTETHVDDGRYGD